MGLEVRCGLIKPYFFWASPYAGWHKNGPEKDDPDRSLVRPCVKWQRIHTRHQNVGSISLAKCPSPPLVGWAVSRARLVCVRTPQSVSLESWPLVDENTNLCQAHRYDIRQISRATRTPTVPPPHTHTHTHTSDTPPYETNKSPPVSWTAAPSVPGQTLPASLALVFLPLLGTKNMRPDLMIRGSQEDYRGLRGK
jgi:hypothetical protein